MFVLFCFRRELLKCTFDFVFSENLVTNRMQKLFSPYFDAVTVVSIESIYRNGSDEVMRVGIYRGRNFKTLFPTTQPR